MIRYEFFITDAHDWNAIRQSLLACSQGRSNEVVFVAESELLPVEETTIGVMVYSICGMGQYVLQVLSKNLIQIPHDALAMHIAVNAGTSVLFCADPSFPQRFIECCRDGRIFDVTVDIKKLNNEGIMQYEQDAQI